MSEQSPTWFAIPLQYLQDPARRVVVARRLGLHVDDLTVLLSGEHSHLSPLTFTSEDSTTVSTVDDVPCLTWARSDAADGGEGDAISLREIGIPHLHWCRASSVYGAAAEAFTGRGDPLLVRVDDDLEPLVGITPRAGRYVVDGQELAAANEYFQARTHILDPWRTNRK